MQLFKQVKHSKDLLNALNKNGERIRSKEEFKGVIEKERIRADRNNHKLSMVIFDINVADPKKTNTTRIIGEIRSRIRCIDETGWYDNQRIGVLLPYTSSEGAAKLAEYICESIEESIPKPECTIFTYPVDK